MVRHLMFYIDEVDASGLFTTFL